MSQDLIEVAKAVAQNAHAPYSNYFVGSALRDDKGRIFAGCNVENISYGATICAERSAICAMVGGGGKLVIEIAIFTRNLGTPCGICLQVLSEFCTPAMPVHLADETGNQRTMLFKELFPQPFAGLD